MSFITEAVMAQVEHSLERIRRNDDLSAEAMRPADDPKMRAEFLAQQRDGRTPEAFRTVLESHGFRFHPPGCRGACCAGSGALRAAGVWRHERLQMAFEPDDVATHFQSPEAFHKWIAEQKMSKRMVRARAPKAEIRKVSERIRRDGA